MPAERLTLCVQDTDRNDQFRPVRSRSGRLLVRLVSDPAADDIPAPSHRATLPEENTAILMASDLSYNEKLRPIAAADQILEMEIVDGLDGITAFTSHHLRHEYGGADPLTGQLITGLQVTDSPQFTDLTLTGILYADRIAEYTGAAGITFSHVFSAVTGSTVGNLTLASGSITDSSGSISFDNENLSTSGTLTLSSLTASRLVATGVGGVLASVADLSSWVAGTANEVDIANDGDGTITVGLVAAVSGLTSIAATTGYFDHIGEQTGAHNIVLDNILYTANGVQVASVNGIDYNPGGDVDVDVVTVGVTGTPRIWWDESEDAWTVTNLLRAAVWFTTPYLYVYDPGGVSTFYEVYTQSNVAADESAMYLWRERVGSPPGAVQNNDALALLSMGGWDGIHYHRGFTIETFATEAWTNAPEAHGTKAIFSTTAIGSSNPAERFTLSSTGLVMAASHTVSSTTFAADHIGERTGSHNVVIDNKTQIIYSGGTELEGLDLQNTLAGGYGTALRFWSKRSDDSTMHEAGRIRVQGELAWNSDANTDSKMGFSVVQDDVVTEYMYLSGLNNIIYLSKQTSHSGNILAGVPGTTGCGTAGNYFGSIYGVTHYVNHIAELTGAHGVFVDNVLHVGGVANYAQFAADGELNLFGTARVRKTYVISNANLGKGTAAPAQVILGNYTGWEFDINDDCVLTTAMPRDWASGTDIEIEICWLIDEAYAVDSAEVRWEISWSMTPHDSSEAVDAPTHTGSDDSGDVNVPALAKSLEESVCVTIPAASISVSDEIGLTLKRIALVGGNNPTAKPMVMHVYVNYIADKLGTAT